jgi:U3 small nucleolar RNA-associated protein 23
MYKASVASFEPAISLSSNAEVSGELDVCGAMTAHEPHVQSAFNFLVARLSETYISRATTTTSHTYRRDEAQARQSTSASIHHILPILTHHQAYKKLLHQYELNFGFREPYQVLLDSSILLDAYATKIDLLSRLQKLLGGTVKPMITTCDMRHLYAATPKNETLILQAKEYERRRCNHQDLEEPLSTLECLGEVVGGSNKNRYIVASNDRTVRARMRGVPGVPLIYINKSVVLMEPMASATEVQREREEKSKFRLGLKGQRKPGEAQKRKRGEDEEERDEQSIADGAMEERPAKKKKSKGPKQPNPLSMMKAKKDKPATASSAPKKSRSSDAHDTRSSVADDDSAPKESSGRKRKRKPKSKVDSGAAPVADDDGSS